MTMMSLRAIARFAPLRATSRIAATNSLVRPAIQSLGRSSILPSINRSAIASFSTTRFRFDEHSQYLAAKLAKEIELETEESSLGSASEAGAKQFLDEVPGWEVNDVEGEQDVFLQKKYDDEEVTVHFTIAEFNSVMPGEDGMEDDMLMEDEDLEGQSGGANTKGASVQGRTRGGDLKVAPDDAVPADRDELADEEDQGPSFPVNVTVLIRRPDSADKGSLRFDLLAENGEFIIQQVTHLPASSAPAVEQIREAYTGKQNSYTGPPFEQLDDEVQQVLEEYLNARGITTHLASFVPDYVDVKEQKEYLAWLGRVKNFVE